MNSEFENNKLGENMYVQESKKKKYKFNVFYLMIFIVAIIIATLVVFIVRWESTNINENVDKTVYKEEIIVDASTIVRPLLDNFIKEFKNFNIKKDYSSNQSVYERLINREVDYILATKPTTQDYQMATSKGVELIATPVASEGFVFFVNKKNSVDNLTLDQVKNIYTGKITNWNEVGGNNNNIICYQGLANSEIQKELSSFVMNGVNVINNNDEYIKDTDDMIKSISKSENNAIGYSYYYEIKKNNKVKLLSINEVEPNYDTIKDSSYPITSSYYIVTLKELTDLTMTKLKEEMVSETGQKIVKKSGYIELQN